MAKVTLKLAKPYMSYDEIVAEKVVIPAAKGDLTVLVDRAPTSLILRNGQVKVLDKDNKILSRYFVKGGMADIAKNVCKVFSEVIDDYNDLSLENSEEKLEESKSDDLKDYYKMIVDEFKIFGKVKK